MIRKILRKHSDAIRNKFNVQVRLQKVDIQYITNVFGNFSVNLFGDLVNLHYLCRRETETNLDL